MYEFNSIKRCVLCGCLALLIITHTGPICKRCLKHLHNEYHLPEEFHGNFSLNDQNSRSAIEATVTGVVDLPIDYIHFRN